MDRTERTDGLGRVLYDGMMDGIASESAVVLSISFPLVLLPPCPLFSSILRDCLLYAYLPPTCPDHSTYHRGPKKKGGENRYTYLAPES